MAKVQASLRGSVGNLEDRPDALVDYIASRPFAKQLAGGTVTRADVLRIAIDAGLTQLEGQRQQWEDKQEVANRIKAMANPPGSAERPVATEQPDVPASVNIPPAIDSTSATEE